MFAIIPGRYMFRIAFSTFLLFLYTLLTPQHGSRPSASANSMALFTITLSDCANTPGSPKRRRMNGNNSRVASRWRSPCLPNMPRRPKPPSTLAAAAISLSSLLIELMDKSVVAMDALSSSCAWAAAYGYSTIRTGETNINLNLHRQQLWQFEFRRSYKSKIKNLLILQFVKGSSAGPGGGSSSTWEKDGWPSDRDCVWVWELDGGFSDSASSSLEISTKFDRWFRQRSPSNIFCSFLMGHHM